MKKNHDKAYSARNLTPQARFLNDKRKLQTEIEEDNNNNIKGQSPYEMQIRPMSANGQSPYGTNANTQNVRGYIDQLHGHFMPIDEGTPEQKAIQNGMCPIFNTNSPTLGESVGANGSYLSLEANNKEGPAVAGNTRNFRALTMTSVTSMAMIGAGGGGFGTSSGQFGQNWSNSTPNDHNTDVSSMIKKRKSSKGTFGTNFKYYFPNLGNTRLKKLLTDLNAYVKSRGHDIEFFNFGVIRDVEAAMVGGPGRSKGSNHGFGLAIDALVKATGKKAKPGSGVVTKKFTLNGELTDKIKGNYHARNKVIIKDHALMKVLDDFSKLPSNKDIRWGGRFKRGTKHEIPNGVGTLYTMELHHWEIAPDAIPALWEPYMSQLKAVGIDKAPIRTSENLKAMQALWGQYQREQQKAQVLAMNTTQTDTETENLKQGGE